jgi:nucleotide-binding universal stress UspA family protein
VLISQSRDADLLVVGHCERGALRSALLGSVGLQCVMHASVPVTVVGTAPHRAVPDDDRDTALAKA